MLSENSELKSLTIADWIVQRLEQEGVEYVFGIPGGYITPFTQIFYKHPKIKFIISRHEEGAAFMADGYARLSGKLGVIFTTAGPGATNALTGIACAQRDQSSLMLIVGTAATSLFGHGAWQDSTEDGINVPAIFRYTCGLSELVVTVQGFCPLFEKALKIAYGYPKQTVQLTIPLDISSNTLSSIAFLEEAQCTLLQCSAVNFDKRDLVSIVKILQSAKAPLIFLGGGSISALSKIEMREIFTQWIVAHEIPVITSPRAKGIFPESHEQSFGVFGIGGSELSENLLQEYKPDVLLVLGSSLNEWASARWSEKLRPTETLIQVDINPKIIGRTYPVDYPIVTDIESFLITLKETNALVNIKHQYNRIQKFRALKSTIQAFYEEEKMHSITLPLKPQRLFNELSKFLKTNDVSIFLDIGNCTGFFSHYVCLDPPNRLYSCYGFTSMGWASGTVIGGKLAVPHRSCLAIIGDGAFLMNGVEIQSATHYGIGAVYLVLNEGYYCMVHHGERALAKQKFEIDDSFFSLGAPDLFNFARALGAMSYVVDRPGELEVILSQAFECADKYRKPQVIIAKIDYKEAGPFGKRFEALEKQIKNNENRQN